MIAVRLEAQPERGRRDHRERCVEGDPDEQAEPDDDHDLHEQRGDEAPSGSPDGSEQSQRAGLLHRDDEEEQPGHERHDERVQQEDDLERLANLGHAGRFVRGLVAGQGVEVVAPGVDRGNERLRVGAVGRDDAERVRQAACPASGLRAATAAR